MALTSRRVSGIVDKPEFEEDVGRTSTTPWTNGRSVPSPTVGAPEPSTTNDEQQATSTTRPYEPSRTASSGYSTAASNTEPPMTNKPPGHTEPTTSQAAA